MILSVLIPRDNFAKFRGFFIRKANFEWLIFSMPRAWMSRAIKVKIYCFHLAELLVWGDGIALPYHPAVHHG